MAVDPNEIGGWIENCPNADLLQTLREQIESKLRRMGVQPRRAHPQPLTQITPPPPPANPLPPAVGKKPLPPLVIEVPKTPTQHAESAMSKVLKDLAPPPETETDASGPTFDLGA